MVDVELLSSLGTETEARAQKTLSRYLKEVERLERKLRNSNHNGGKIRDWKKRRQELTEKIADLMVKNGELNTKLAY